MSSTPTIPERLRKAVGRNGEWRDHTFDGLMTDAAMEIEGLRVGLEGALETIEWMYGCTAPAEDEIEKSIAEIKEVLGRE